MEYEMKLQMIRERNEEKAREQQEKEGLRQRNLRKKRQQV
jgi:hypothetical protein